MKTKSRLPLIILSAIALATAASVASAGAVPTDRAVFVASGLYRLGGTAGYESLKTAVLLRQATRIYDRRFNLDPSEGLKYLALFSKAYDDALGTAQGKPPSVLTETDRFVVKAALATASGLTPGSRLGAAAAGVLGEVFEPAVNTVFQGLEQAAGSQKHARQAVTRTQRLGQSGLEQTLGQAWDLYNEPDPHGAGAPAFKQVYDQILAEPLHARPSDGRLQILASNPALQADWALDQRLNALNEKIAQLAAGTSGANPEAISQLRTELTAELAELNTQARDAITAAATAAKTFAPAANSASPAGAAAPSLSEEDQRQAQIRQAQAAQVYVIAHGLALLGPEGAKVGQAFAASAQAAMQVRSAVEAYRQRLGAGAFSATSLLTGDLLSIGINLAGAILGGPSPDQLILQQLAELREQVSKMRAEMHERFDAVDRKLDVLLDTVVRNFNEIHVAMQAGFSQTESSAMGNYFKLLEIQTALDRQDTRMMEALEQVADRPDARLREDCLARDPRISGDAFKVAEFLDCVLAFKRLATEATLDDLGGLTEDGIRSRLQSQTPESVAPFLGRLAARNGVSVPGPLVNGERWIEGTDGLLRFLVKWPERQKLVGRRSINALLQAGENFRAFAQSLAKPGTIFQSLIKEMRDQTAAMRTSIWTQSAPEYGRRVLGNINPADPSVESQSELPIALDVNMYENCDSSRPKEAPSIDVRNAVVPTVMKQASLMGLGQIQTCFTYRWVGDTGTEEIIPRSDKHYTEYRPFAHFPSLSSRKRFATSQMEVYFRFGPIAGVPRVDHTAGKNYELGGQVLVSSQIWELWSRGAIGTMSGDGATIVDWMNSLNREAGHNPDPTQDKLWVGLSGNPELLHTYTHVEDAWNAQWNDQRTVFLLGVPRFPSNLPELAPLAAAVVQAKANHRNELLNSLDQLLAHQANPGSVSVDQVEAVRAKLAHIGYVKSLLEAYTRWSLGDAFERHDRLRGSLRGTAALIDDEMLQAPSIASLGSSLGATADARGQMDERLDTVEKILFEEVLPVAGPVSPPAEIEATMQRLETAHALMRASLPAEDLSEIAADLEARVESIAAQLEHG